MKIHPRYKSPKDARTKLITVRRPNRRVRLVNLNLMPRPSAYGHPRPRRLDLSGFDAITGQHFPASLETMAEIARLEHIAETVLA